MANGLTRGERRGLIGLLAVLAVIIAITALSGGVKAPPARVVESREDDTVAIEYRNDTTIARLPERKRRKSKIIREKTVKRQPERSPLDEVIPSR